MTLIPVHPEPDGYQMYAVTWLSQDGKEITCLFGALSAEEAARTALGFDPRLRGSGHPDSASIDVRICGPVRTFRIELSV